MRKAPERLSEFRRLAQRRASGGLRRTPAVGQRCGAAARSLGEAAFRRCPALTGLPLPGHAESDVQPYRSARPDELERRVRHGVAPACASACRPATQQSCRNLPYTSRVSSGDSFDRTGLMPPPCSALHNSSHAATTAADRGSRRHHPPPTERHEPHHDLRTDPQRDPRSQPVLPDAGAEPDPQRPRAGAVPARHLGRGGRHAGAADARRRCSRSLPATRCCAASASTTTWSGRCSPTTTSRPSNDTTSRLHASILMAGRHHETV